MILPIFLIFILFGIQESFAEEKTWYVGEGLKQGDIFSYKLCHTDYKDCSEFLMELWIEGDIQIASETLWLSQTKVSENNKLVKGVMHLGKVAAEPVYSSQEIASYKSAFRTSVAELAAYSSILQPGNLTLGDNWYKDMKFIPIGAIPTNIIAIENEKITVPAGTFDTTVLSYTNTHDKIWVVDDFPFPIKAETWEERDEPKTKRYQFELQYYENVSDPKHAFSPLNEGIAHQELTPEMVNEMVKSLSPELKTPKQQTDVGILPSEVECKEGLELIFKYNGSPACVKPSTAEKLIERGWARV